MRYHAWLLTLLIAACAADPVPPLSSTELVGTWRYIPFYPDKTPIEEREIVVFGADGSYSIRDSRGSQSGTYQLAGHDVTIRSTAGTWVTTGFAATADRLIIDALFPDGEHDGLVGTWSGAQSSDTVTSIVELELRVDGTARVAQTGSLAEETDATWFQADPYAIVTFAGSTRKRAYPALPDLAIGEWLYERIP